MFKTMKLFAVAGLVGTFALPVFAQVEQADVSTMTCAEFRDLDATGQSTAVNFVLNVGADGTFAGPTIDSPTTSTDTTTPMIGTADGQTIGAGAPVEAEAELVLGEVVALTVASCTTAPDQLMVDVLMAQP
jgi:hypothetical protein